MKSKKKFGTFDEKEVPKASVCRRKHFYWRRIWRSFRNFGNPCETDRPNGNRGSLEISVHSSKRRNAVESGSFLLLIFVCCASCSWNCALKFCVPEHTLDTLLAVDQQALFLASWIVHALLAVVLLSGLLKRRCSVNAGEAKPPFKLWWCTGFMFRRRGALLRRLARLAAHEAQRPVEALLKRLQGSQLETLGLAVESRGAEPGPCLPMRAAELLRLERGGPALPPHLLFCQLWRWADLRTTQELRPLPVCQNSDPRYVCCNPYHWSRLYKPDSPPPPYIVSQEKIESTCSESRFSSNFSGSSESSTFRPWCNIAYWEMSTRVGRLLPVADPSINVFADLPHGAGLCLETLAQSHMTDNTSVLQTRAKIGQGITIFREEEEVWVYNRSDYPVFVNSPTLDPPNTENFTVYKLLPGYSIKLFDYEKSLVNQRLQDPSLLKDGPFDPYAVRVSFAKGWGSSKYSRRFITSCPCWLEVMFRVNR